MRGRPLRTRQRARFLERLAETGNVTLAAESIEVGRSTVYDNRRADPEFAKAWDEALETSIDRLEAEARRRAVEGTEEYITSRDGLVRDEAGNPVMQRRYSDTLMSLLLRAHKPEKYRDRSSVDVTLPTDMARLIEEGRKRAQRAMTGEGEKEIEG